jgi:ABC-type transporter Mla subunit MlaD
MSTDTLQRLKNQSLMREDEATLTLDSYYAAVDGGRGLNATDLLHQVTAIKTAINEHKNASENYITQLEEIVSKR